MFFFFLFTVCLFDLVPLSDDDVLPALLLYRLFFIDLSGGGVSCIEWELSAMGMVVDDDDCAGVTFGGLSVTFMVACDSPLSTTFLSRICSKNFTNDPLGIHWPWLIAPVVDFMLSSRRRFV